MAQEIIGTPLAGLAYVYYSFCSFTDGYVSDEELQVLIDEIHAASAGLGFTKEDTDQAIDDAQIMFDGCPTGQEKVDLFTRTLDLLQAQPWWTQGLCEVVVQGLERMRDADGERHENETYWIEAVKEAWKVA